MTAIGCGPLWRIDGPPPTPPVYTLIGAARVIDDVDGSGIERFGNGVEVYPFPADAALIHDAFATGSDRIKSAGGVLPHPQFGAMTVYLAETCSALGIFGAGLSNEQAQARFVARANAAFAAAEYSAVEREFFAGDVLPLNPHLADGNGTFPVGNTTQSVVEGFALLENEIAASGQRGLLHCSPAMLVAAAANHIVEHDDRAGTIRTMNGTVVVPGFGYRDATVHPAGHSAASGTEEWLYATGPIEVRRSPLMLEPAELSQALDRSLNLITYRAERIDVVDWDTLVQAAVRVDRTK